MLSVAAIILGVIYAIVILLGVAMSVRTKTFTGLSFFGMILSALFAALIVYDTSCLTQGGCTAWSWVRTAFYAIIPIILAMMYASALLS